MLMPKSIVQPDGGVGSLGGPPQMALVIPRMSTHNVDPTSVDSGYPTSIKPNFFIVINDSNIVRCN